MSFSLRPSLNWLFVFIPITVALEHWFHVSPPVLFFSAALAIIPIAALIVRSTEHLATYTGDAVGGLLNATFGNAPELIISLVALKSGLYEMVLASIIGAILANLLLAMGISFLLGGMRKHTQQFNTAAARAYSSMMLIAVISMTVPSSFSRFFAPQATIRQEQYLNIGLSIVLLIAYGLYLVFTIRTHPELFASHDDHGPAHGPDSHGQNSHGHHAGPRWSWQRAVGSLVLASVLAAWMSEMLVGAAEGTGKALGMSQTFIGIVIVAIVGGAAESGSAIAMARKNKMDLSLGIALGSCIQIALFIAPIVALASLVIGPRPLELSFTRAEIGCLFLGVLMGTSVCKDGESNWYEGVQLITVYVIMALMFYLMPEVAH